MPQSPILAKPSSGNGEALGLAAVLPSTAAGSPTSSGSSRSGRSKRGGSSLARRRLRRVLDNTQKHYAPHVCRFAPYRPPAAAVLDPFPNLRINAICMAGLATLITVHRSGVRLYRERSLTPSVSYNNNNTSSSAVAGASAASAYPMLSFSSQSIAALRGVGAAPAANTASTTAVLRGVSTASGVFEQIEVRNDFQIRESYLCTAMQPVLVDDAVLLSKWSRYFCVASGNDRVVHSVAVMSSGAHFCLHHEKHQTNKVVCMHCTQVATEPFHPTVLKPAVVSVDEVGTVVLFDVEREVPCVLERAPLWFTQSDARASAATNSDEQRQQGTANRTDGAVDASPHREDREAPQPYPQPTSLLSQHLTPEEEDHVVEAMEKVPVKDRATFHLDHGVATRVTLVGPCLELCNHCHNAFMSLAATRGYTLVSLYVSTRAQDLPSDGTGTTASTAELNVVLLRVLWGPRRAFVLEEVTMVQEAAPTDVCEAGVAAAARPYQVGLPMTLLLARPALTLWQLRACTGQRIDTRSLYPSKKSDTPSPEARGSAAAKKATRYGTPPRAASEFIIHWVPLGRHRLAMQSDDRIGPQSWFCIAAVTDDDTVLLLGRAPQSCTVVPAVTSAAAAAVAAPAHLPATASTATSTSAFALTAKEDEPEKFKDANLEGWLDDLHPSPTPSPPPPPLSGETADREGTTRTAGTAAGTRSAAAATAASAGANASPVLPYTVLMKLYSPGGASTSRSGGLSSGAAAPSVAAGVLSIMPDLRDNRLILFMADEEALLSVPLPFAERMATLTEGDPATEGLDGGRPGAAGRSLVRNGAGVHQPATPSTEKANNSNNNNGSVHDTSAHTPEAAGASASSGYSQYLWGATSKAVSAASQGWTSSVQKWAPASSSSYFFFSGGSDTTNAYVTANGSTAASAPRPSPLRAEGAPASLDTRSLSSSPPRAASVGQSAPPATKVVPAAVSAAATPAESYRPFSIARPLMAAVFHLTGEDKESPLVPARPPSPPPATTVETAIQQSTQNTDASAAKEDEGREWDSAPLAVPMHSPSAPSPLPAAAQQQSKALPSNEHSFHSVDAHSTSEASTAATSLAVPIRVAHSDRDRSGSRAASVGSRHSSHACSHDSRHSPLHRPTHRHSRRQPSATLLCEEEVGCSSNNSGGHRGNDDDDNAEWGSSRHRRRRRRGPQAAGTAAASSASRASPLPPVPHTVTIEDGVAQASYVEEQMHLLTSTDGATGVAEEGSEVGATGGYGESRRGGPTQEEVRVALRHLVDVEEPLERNMLLYSWKDGHNDLYIRLSVGQDALEQTAAAQKAGLNDAAHHSTRVSSPRRHHDALHTALTNVTHTSSDVVEGVHSVGFLSAYHEVVAWRTETASYGNCFHFADYFTTLQVPQHVADVQERDKCRLELEDLRLQQARDLTNVHPFALMAVCQNEERRSADAPWRLHDTFPYDDETDGSVVDLNWLNRTAGSTTASSRGSAATPEWRWATEREMRIWAEENGQSTRELQRVRSLVRELKDWSVGPWEYAERWPAQAASKSTAAAAAVWSAVETPAHRCRRRRLTRLRVNVAELRRQSELTESHIRELSALREELGL